MIENRNPEDKASYPDFNDRPLIPPVEVARPSTGDEDLNRWAAARINIYAALDATMTRLIIEAISALGEIKYQAEEEARQTNQSVMAERDRLRSEVESLRLEQLRLNDHIKDGQQLVQEEEARRLALERTNTASSEQAEAEQN